MIESERVKKILYGGDYNPEQWPEETWAEDMRLLKMAHINELTVNVFSWASLQTDDDTYHFEKLDKIMDMAKENGMSVCLATSTAAHPAWMAKKYPDILRTEFNGIGRKFGARHNSCPNSPTYHRFSVELARRLAQRYKNYENIVGWHISNEYGGECYCENCEKAFREWLKEKYGTIEEVNRAWDTAFWGHTFYDFDEIVAPDLRSEAFGYNRTNFQGITLDYRRFNSESILKCYRLEYDAIKKITPDIPITTNFMGGYYTLDYKSWAPYLDFVSWDNYPYPTEEYQHIAFQHDQFRGLKGGKPFALMEQTPSVTNWQPYNSLKRPGVMRLWSYQAMAHGADTILFFQMKRSIGACEKYHGAVIDHVGNEKTRVFREITGLGAELEKLQDQTLGGRTQAKAAIVFDWDNWWATDNSAGPSIRLHYEEEVYKYYKVFNNANIPVDVIGVEDSLEKYSLVIAPVLYMVKGDYDEKIRTFVKNGGTFITTFFSGYVDDSDLVTIGGYPGKLRDILGIWAEEEDALPEGKSNSFLFNGEKYAADILCDIIHPEGAEVLATYEEDFYRGMPVVTKNQFGKGEAYYVATSPDGGFLSTFISEICKEKGIKEILETPFEVEATKRTNQNGTFVFLLNHAQEEKIVTLPFACTDILCDKEFGQNEQVTIPSKGVCIMKVR